MDDLHSICTKKGKRTEHGRACGDFTWFFRTTVALKRNTLYYYYLIHGKGVLTFQAWFQNMEDWQLGGF